MAQTPSKRRREGRESFCPNTHPNDICPYPGSSWLRASYRRDWMDGWYEAQQEHDQRGRDERERQAGMIRVHIKGCLDDSHNGEYGGLEEECPLCRIRALEGELEACRKERR